MYDTFGKHNHVMQFSVESGPLNDKRILYVHLDTMLEILGSKRIPDGWQPLN